MQLLHQRGHETIKMGALNLDNITKILMTDMTLSIFGTKLQFYKIKEHNC